MSELFLQCERKILQKIWAMQPNEDIDSAATLLFPPGKNGSSKQIFSHCHSSETTTILQLVLRCDFKVRRIQDLGRLPTGLFFVCYFYSFPGYPIHRGIFVTNRAALSTLGGYYAGGNRFEISFEDVHFSVEPYSSPSERTVQLLMLFYGGKVVFPSQVRQLLDHAFSRTALNIRHQNAPTPFHPFHSFALPRSASNCPFYNAEPFVFG